MNEMKDLLNSIEGVYSDLVKRLNNLNKEHTSLQIENDQLKKQLVDKENKYNELKEKWNKMVDTLKKEVK